MVLSFGNNPKCLCGCSLCSYGHRVAQQCQDESQGLRYEPPWLQGNHKQLKDENLNFKVSIPEADAMVSTYSMVQPPRLRDESPWMHDEPPRLKDKTPLSGTVSRAPG